MFVKTFPRILKDEVWSKVLTLGMILFLILLADATLSFWVPNFIQDSLQSSFLMGLVISFSSVVGFGADLIFPQILRGFTVKRLILLGILSSFLFSAILLGATAAPYLVIFLLAMAVWGIYYELLGFGEQQFVADSTPLRLHSAAWGVMSIFRSLAYFLGPIIGGLLLARGDRTPAYFAILFTFLGLVFLMLAREKHKRPIEIDVHEVNLIRELAHWKVLFSHVWPIVIMSIFMGLVDATFWTTGAVWSHTLSERSWWGGMFLPLYTLPSLFVGFVVAKWQVFEGKKRLAEKFLFFSGIFLAMLGLTDAIFFQLLFVFVSSTLLAVSFPLTDGVYSDIVARMGRERRHLIGLSRSTISIAYIIGPAWAGFIASTIGERLTFSAVGITVVVVSAVLLLTTPKKLKLPQEEIKKWE